MKRSLDDFGFPRSWHRCDELRHAQQRWNSERDSLRRDFGSRTEPSLSDLLLFTFIVQGHDLDIARIVEIRNAGVIERQVTILSDAHQAELRMGRPQRLRVVLAEPLGIRGITINVIESQYPH